jgi:hypothetical protein
MSKFKEQNESNAPMASTPKGSLRRRLTLYSGLNGKQIDSSSSKSEDEVIQELYKTMFLKPYEDGAERVRKLDFEFSKVIEFFKKTVKQVVDEVSMLASLSLSLPAHVLAPHFKAICYSFHHHHVIILLAITPRSYV